MVVVVEAVQELQLAQEAAGLPFRVWVFRLLVHLAELQLVEGADHELALVVI